jgi:hypothetical protein
MMVMGVIIAAPPNPPGSKPPGGGPPGWAGPPPWAGGPTEPVECDTPEIRYCQWDDFLEELYAEWDDILGEGECTKYGGDVEFEIEVMYDCTDPAVTGATFDLVVEIDLDTDPAEPFAYMCDSGTCAAMIEYADLFAHLDAAADAAADGMCNPGIHSNVSYDDWREDPYPLFSLKQMNPGPGNGRQNRMKDYEDCLSSGAF